MRLLISIFVCSFLVATHSWAQPLVYARKKVSIISQVEQPVIAKKAPEEEVTEEQIPEPPEPKIVNYNVMLRSPDFLLSDLIFNNPFKSGEGILVIFDTEQIIAFSFNNVFVPRDLVFINSQNRIIEIIPSASAESSAEITSSDPVKALLQLNGGDTTSYNIKTGDTVRLN